MVPSAGESNHFLMHFNALAPLRRLTAPAPSTILSITSAFDPNLLPSFMDADHRAKSPWASNGLERHLRRTIAPLMQSHGRRAAA